MSEFLPAVENLNKLTLAFAKAVGNGQADPADNLVVSPYNALMALSIVTMAAGGNTRAELQKSLFNNSQDRTFNLIADFLRIDDDVKAVNEGKVDVLTANGFWANPDRIELKKSFVADIENLLTLKCQPKHSAPNWWPISIPGPAKKPRV